MSEKKDSDQKLPENNQNQGGRTERPERNNLNKGIYERSPVPKAWQPITDETDTAPPDGGSGVGDSKDE